MKKMPTFCPNGPSYAAPAGWPGAAWPIEWFREAGALLPGVGPVVQTFFSSGTTGGPRSKSPFSQLGLDLYKVASLTGFGAMMRDAGLKSGVGVSLVPPPHEWPDSSLAQMVGWIAGAGPVHYTDGGRLGATLKTLDQSTPVWVFGTAFHFVDLLDRFSTVDLALPPGSKIIETGGTKGKTRAVTRDELYTALARHFGVTTDDIISEYGMCELAAQAYDVASGGTRRLRFPAWVRCGVVTSPGVIESQGEGALVVWDPMRVDVPVPIRTEDLVALDPDGGFRLLGRLGGAPLRGCSLRVEEAVARDAKRAEPARAVPRPISTFEDWHRRAAAVDACVRAWACAEATQAALTAELASASAASVALDDLFVTLPATASAWFDAARAATGSDGTPQRWLVILPDSHPMVAVPALALGVIAGLTLQVRMPRSLDTAASSLSLLIDALRNIGTPLMTLPSTWRLGGDEGGHDYDAVLCYGDDTTVAQIAAASGRPTQGFGNRFGISITTRTEFDAARLARDTLGLGQRGCMSSRLVVVASASERDMAQLAEDVAVAGAAFWQTPLPSALRAALDVERCRYETLGAHVFAPRDATMPLVAAFCADHGEALPALSDMIAMRTHVIPLALVKEDSLSFVKTVAQWLKHRDIGTITASSSLVPKVAAVANSHLPGVSLRELGAAQRPPFSGLHEGRALFVPPGFSPLVP